MLSLNTKIVIEQLQNLTKFKIVIYCNWKVKFGVMIMEILLINLLLSFSMNFCNKVWCEETRADIYMTCHGTTRKVCTFALSGCCSGCTCSLVNWKPFKGQILNLWYTSLPFIQGHQVFLRNRKIFRALSNKVETCIFLFGMCEISSPPCYRQIAML
jgi:hypothetical protein